MISLVHRRHPDNLFCRPEAHFESCLEQAPACPPQVLPRIDAVGGSSKAVDWAQHFVTPS